MLENKLAVVEWGLDCVPKLVDRGTVDFELEFAFFHVDMQVEIEKGVVANLFELPLHFFQRARDGDILLWVLADGVGAVFDVQDFEDAEIQNDFHCLELDIEDDGRFEYNGFEPFFLKLGLKHWNLEDLRGELHVANGLSQRSNI